MSSQKRSKALRLKSQANKGKGRFSYSAIASEATWDTNFAGDEGLYQYTIQLSSSNKANVRESDVIGVSAEDHQTGTIVSTKPNPAPIIADIEISKDSLKQARADIIKELQKEFYR